MRLVSGARRGCFVAAAAAGLFGLVAPGASGADADRPGQWDSTSAAAAVEVIANTSPAQVVADVVRLDLPDSESTWSTNIAKARASTFYPGVVLTQGGNLLCQTPLKCVPTPHPFTAYAEYPESPDGKTEVGSSVVNGPLAFDASAVKAHAGTDKVVAEANDGRLQITGSPAASSAALDLRRAIAAARGGAIAAAAVRPSADDATVVRAAALTSKTSHTFDHGALVVTGEARLTGIGLLGGTITIDSIVSRAVSEVDSTGKGTAEQTMTVAGVSVGGNPARIDEEGITVGPGGPQGADAIAQLNKALRDALSAANLQISALQGDRQVQDGSAKATVGGILIAGGADAGALPGGTGVVTSVLLGKTGTIAAASAGAGDLLSGVGDDLSGDARPALPDAATGPGVLGDSTLGALAAPASAASPGAPASPHSRPAAGARGAGRAIPAAFTDPAAARVKALYLALALAFLGLALGWRRALPGASRAARPKP